MIFALLTSGELTSGELTTSEPTTAEWLTGLIELFLRSAFVDNLALAYFLGMCTFLAVSKNVKTAIGLGVAVIAVQAITVPVNNLIFNYCLKEGAIAQLSLIHI